MRRREFVTLMGGAAIVWPVTTRAQEQGRTYRLGSLQQSRRDAPHHVAFYDELRRQGFVEGQNLLVDTQGYELRVNQLAEHAAALVKAKVDVIICAGNEAVRAGQQATKTIPILAISNDMVGQGFVRSLTNLEGNITGFSLLATELDGKRQEILIDLVPGARRVASIIDPQYTSPQRAQLLQEAARTRGVELMIYPISTTDEIVGAIETAKKSGAESLNVLASALLFANRKIIFERVAALGMPAMYESPMEGEEGGLIAYGPSLVQLYRDVFARQLVRLLRGSKPADLPIEQPTKFDLVINLKTAKALGLKIPESFLVRADKVLE
jgi:putative tryptophan/tyrosine transport system substrate-binding protein